jgi:hypothetical protein
MIATAIRKPTKRKGSRGNSPQVNAGTMRLPIVGKPPKVGQQVFIDRTGTDLIEHGLEGGRPNSVGLVIGVIRAVSGNTATVQILKSHPARRLLQEMASEGHLQIENGDARPTLRLAGRSDRSTRVQESLTFFESLSQMATATTTDTNAGIKTAFLNAIASVAGKSNLSPAVRSQKIRKLMKVLDDLVKMFGADASAVQEDDDTDVEEDMPTPGENGTLAESYRRRHSGRALLESRRGTPRTTGSVLEYLDGGPRRRNSVLKALGRDDSEASSLLESIGRGIGRTNSVSRFLGR